MTHLQNKPTVTLSTLITSITSKNNRAYKPLLATLLSTLLGTTGMLISMHAHAEEGYDLELTITKKGEVTEEQVAFVPFAGSAAISSIIEKDLQSTPLKTTSQGLIGQPHSSDELKVTLPAWQQFGLPYLVVGSSHTMRGNTQIDFEVIEVNHGRIIKGKQRVNDPDPKVAARKASSRIYELITGNKIDLNASLLYIEEKGTGAQQTSTLILRNADGSNPTPLISVTDARIYPPAISPDGRYIAYSVQQKNNNAYLYRYDRQTKQITPLVNLKGSNLSPSFSPDGSMILFSSSASGNHDIYRVSSHGGQAERILALPYDQISPRYLPNGSFVFVSDHIGKRPSIYRYNFQGAPIRISRGGYATNPSVSPDGTKIAFLNGSNAAIMDMSGNILANYGSTGIDQAPSFSPTGERVVYSQGAKNSRLIIRFVKGGKTITLPANGVVKSPIWIPSGY